MEMTYEQYLGELESERVHVTTGQAVSYTHLDVYKRQAQRLRQGADLILRWATQHQPVA